MTTASTTALPVQGRLKSLDLLRGLDLSCLSDSSPILGQWYDTVLTAGNFAIVFLILAWMHRDRLCMRI